MPYPLVGSFPGVLAGGVEADWMQRLFEGHQWHLKDHNVRAVCCDLCTTRSIQARALSRGNLPLILRKYPTYEGRRTSMYRITAASY